MIRNSVILAELEDFIRKWNNGDLVLTDKADTMEVTYTTGETNFWGKPKITRKFLPDYIGYAITSYQHAREIGNFHLLFNKAMELLDTIQRARAYNCLVNPTQKVVDYENQINALKEQNTSLRKLNTKLTQENKRLRIFLPPNTEIGKTEEGDVE